MAVIAAFAKMTDEYYQGCFNFHSNFFSRSSNYLWVMHQYQRQLQTTIYAYNLGKISTDQFLRDLLEVFTFLDDQSFVPDAKQAADLEKNKKNHLTFCAINDGERRTRQQYARGVLEQTWNMALAFHEADFAKLRKVIEAAGNEKIYLISDTNELHLYHIITHYFGQVLSLSSDTKSYLNPDENEFLNLTEQVVLFPSFCAQAFKSAKDYAYNDNITPTLLSLLVVKEQLDLTQTVLISHYQKDFDAARVHGFYKQNIIDAENYFSDIARENSDDSKAHFKAE